MLGPARLGSVHQAVLAGYKRIALVDAYFGNVPSVWHKELLFAIASGCEVWGSSSTGALRAAELDVYGMRGIGAAYRLFRRGALSGEDEPCLLHGDHASGYIHLTYPMLNIRSTLRTMRRLGYFGASAEEDFTREMKLIHFTERSQEAVRQVFQEHVGASSNSLWQRFVSAYTDMKKQDTCALYRALERSSALTGTLPQNWQFPRTTFWVRQFIAHNDDFPPLEGDYASTGASIWRA